ncbi:unnamed protein product [Caenorhabditis sp. 36 PRJEB53466]|nr:unnamed protein product [Caenorhabditis sp. 36 PRJEB53466]
MATFESLAYPFKRTIQFEVDDIKRVDRKLELRKHKDNNAFQLVADLCVNPNDESDWWACEADHEARIVSTTGSHYTLYTAPSWFYKNHWIGESVRMDWDELLLPQNGYCLAQQSPFFNRLFEGHPETSEFEISVKLEDFITFLELVHNCDTHILEKNIENVLELIQSYEAFECFERFDLVLKKMELKDTIKVLHLVDKYRLPELRKVFLRKLKDEALLKTVLSSANYKTLSNEMKVAILEWKLVPEESRTEEVAPTGYRFSTDFEENRVFCDVMIQVERFEYHVSKQILANSSHYFMKRFYGPFSENEDVIRVFKVAPFQFEKLLTHIYHPSRPVTVANFDSLLELAHQFSVPRLMDKCEEFLVLSHTMNPIDKLEYAGKYDLPFLLESHGAAFATFTKREVIREEKSMR